MSHDEDLVLVFGLGIMVHGRIGTMVTGGGNVLNDYEYCVKSIIQYPRFIRGGIGRENREKRASEREREREGLILRTVYGH